MKGGKRKGAGRPKGSLDKSTIEKKKAEELMKQRILRRLNPLLNSQFALAEGLNFVYRIDYFKGEDGKKHKKFTLITAESEIEAVLDETEGLGGLVDEKYYIVTAKAPDNKAIDSMLDRVFGKATQKIGGDKDSDPIQLTWKSKSLTNPADGPKVSIAA